MSLLALTGCEYSYKMGNKGDAGRYEIVERGGVTFLLDTHTGNSWRQVTMLTGKRELMSIFWEPMTKFDTEAAGDAHVAYVNDLIEFSDRQPPK